MGPRRFALGFLTVQSRASILDPNSKPITSVAAYFPPTAGQIPAAECDRSSVRQYNPALVNVVGALEITVQCVELANAQPAKQNDNKTRYADQ